MTTEYIFSSSHGIFTNIGHVMAIKYALINSSTVEIIETFREL